MGLNITKLGIDVEGYGEEQLRTLFGFIGLKLKGQQFVRYEFSEVNEHACFILYFWCPVENGIYELPYEMNCEQALSLISGWLKNLFVNDPPSWRVFSDFSKLPGNHDHKYGIAIESIFDLDENH